MRVIIADDEAKVRQLIRMFLEQETFLEPLEIVGEARNGTAALALIEQTVPDIIITDIRMPGCGGLDLIRQARERAPQISFIIISGYELFEYAHEAIKYGVEDYLLKPVKKDELRHAINCIMEKHSKTAQFQANYQEMVQDLQRVSDEKQQALLQQLVQHKHWQRSDWNTAHLQETYDFTLSGPQYLPIILKIDIPDSTDLVGFSGFLERQAERTINKHLTAFEQIRWISGAYIYMLLSITNDQMTPLRKIMGQLIYELRSSNNIVSSIHVTAALGKPARHPSAIPESFYTAEFAMQNRLLRGVDRVLDGETPHDMYDVRDFINTSVHRKLMNEIEAQNFEEVTLLIKRMGTHIIAAQGCTGRLIRRTADELVNLILFSAKDVLSPEDQDKRRNQVLARIDMCPGAMNLFDVLCQQLQEILTACRMLRGQQEAKPVEAAKRFIRMYYGQDISQDEVAVSVGLSTAYLSSLFKKETGTSFSEFLTETRIRAACDLMLSTSSPVAQIAETVGYNDVKYFNKVFRKTTGLSPSAYRKLYY